MAKASATIDISALKVAGTNATGYITDIGSDGIRIHDAYTTNNSIVINSNGMEIFKGGSSVAFYGDTARIGEVANSKTRMALDNSTISLISRNSSGADATLCVSASNANTLRIGDPDYSAFLSLTKDTANPSIYMYSVRPNGASVITHYDEIILSGGTANTEKTGLKYKFDTGGGVLTSDASLTVMGHSSAIGSQVNGTKVDTSSTAIPDSINVTTGNGTSIAQLVLPAGVWIVYGQARFASNSTGYRRMGFSATKNNASLDVTFGASSSGATQISNTRVLSPSSQTTYYLNVTHNGGTTLAISDIVFSAWRLV